MSNKKRAYSDADKQQREDNIIGAAETLLKEKDYLAINMAEVAQSAGLAKGTLYLYFKTREELFLKVFERQTVSWRDEIEQSLGEIDSSDEALIELLVKTTMDRPLFTRLVALSPIVLEYNVALEQLREHKLWVYGNLYEVAHLLEEKFDLRPTQGTHLLLTMFVFVAGLEGFAHPAPMTGHIIDSEPSLVTIDFESELRSLLVALLAVASA
ncbi:MAG: TetR family transcriptional regulator [Aggregatilineales bacterium]